MCVRVQERASMHSARIYDSPLRAHVCVYLYVCLLDALECPRNLFAIVLYVKRVLTRANFRIFHDAD